MEAMLPLCVMKGIKMALFNAQGVQVFVPKLDNRKREESILTGLREKHVPVVPYPKGMFSIEQRMHLKV